MLLIWGFKALYKTLGEGTFYCPNDGGDRSYRVRQARKWFTFFWIPIIPLRVLGEFVECRSCRNAYDKSVLTMPTSAQMMDNLANAVRQAVVSIITADGVVGDGEREVGLAVMQRFTDTPYTMADLDDDLKDLRHGDLGSQLERAAGTLNEQGKESLLAACMEIAAADGDIDDSEVSEVRRAGAALGMSPLHVRGVIAQAKEQLGSPVD